MAIVIRGAVQAGAGDLNAETSLTPGVPAGTAAGDLLLLSGCFSGGSTSTVATPSGWTAIYTPTASQQTNDNLCLFARIADGTATDSPALTISPTVEMFIATCLALGGTNGVLPVPASTAAIALGGAASTTITYPAITPSTAADLLVYVTGLRPSTSGTQVTAVQPSGGGGTGGALVTQIDGITNKATAANSEQAVITQQLTAATAVTQQTATVSATVSSVIVAVVVTPAAVAASASPAQPGKTWLRRFHHRQQLPPPVSVIAPAAPAGTAVFQAPRVRPGPHRASLGARGALAAGVLAAGIGPPAVPAPHQPPAITHPAPHRALWRAVAGRPPGAAPSLGAPQPFRPATVYRRAAHGAIWKAIAGRPPGATAQPFKPATVHRRKPHGAAWRAITGRPPAAVRQPRNPATVFARAPHRALWRAGAGSPPPPPPPFTVGALTAATAPAATLGAGDTPTSALTGGTAAAGALTATDQRAGGPS